MSLEHDIRDALAESVETAASKDLRALIIICAVVAALLAVAALLVATVEHIDAIGWCHFATALKSALCG